MLMRAEPKNGHGSFEVLRHPAEDGSSNKHGSVQDEKIQQFLGGVVTDIPTMHATII